MRPFAAEISALPTGLPATGDLDPGTHFCQFYRTREDLLDTLVPFFRAGLLNGEQCLWITCDPLRADDAWRSLALAVPDLEKRKQAGQIEIFDHEQWYLKTGAMSADAVLSMWLDREAKALDSGAKGLRLSGNTYWLEKHQFAAFHDYEAAVHRAFHGRRILALCSYSLDKCSADDLLDVLRHHEFTLMRRNGAWESVKSATQVISSAPKPRSHSHLVQFYDDRFPSEICANFLAEGLLQGSGAVVVSTPEHRDAIRTALRSCGVDADACVSSQQLMILDAEETLAQIDFDRSDEEIAQAIRNRIAPLASRHPRCHVYGEMVDLLVRRKEESKAIRLEKIWNGLIEEHRFEVLCTYSMSALDGQTDAFRSICDHHGVVHPMPHEGSPGDEIFRADSGRLVAQIQHQARALRLESERRSKLEDERSTSSDDAKQLAVHLSALQRVTEALSEAAGVSDIGRVASNAMTRILGADDGLLTTIASDGWLEVQDASGRLEREFGNVLPMRFAPDARLPAAEAYRTGKIVVATRSDSDRFPVFAALRDVHAILAIPLEVAGQRMGSLVFGFKEPLELSTRTRALAHDLARQTALALERARLFDRANEANRRKDEFIAVLGHELRNPLAPIMTALQLMRLRGDTSLANERAVIERQVLHVSRLVDDLLDVSRITRGKLELKKERVELWSVVARAMEMASPLFEQRSHRVTLDVPREGLTVDVDPLRLAQAISNLLNNAAKYTDRGGDVTVTCDRVEQGARIRVRDNGAGLRQDVIPLLFEPFVQGQRTLERSQGGLGLGLALVRSLVEIHGGHVSAASDGPGKGSEFTIVIGLAEEPAAASAELRADIASAARTARKRILVVDDNPDAADVLGEMFRHVGHEVLVAYDGPSALEKASSFAFDVAVLDIGLPVMDGYEVGRQLSELSNGRKVTLVALTGYGTEEDRARTSAAGFHAHMTKPVEGDRLLELIGTPRK